jgi:hypothetical protein
MLCDPSATGIVPDGDMGALGDLEAVIETRVMDLDANPYYRT